MASEKTMNETSSRIDLIYFDACPHAEAARDNLNGALEALGLEADWTEWVQDRPEAPDWVRAFPSPTVLVNRRNVAGFAGAADGFTCAADGAPSSALIRQALAEI